VLVSGLPPSASWQDLKVSISVDQLLTAPDYNSSSVCMCVWGVKGYCGIRISENYCFT
jgi:hypothetical protein